MLPISRLHHLFPLEPVPVSKLHKSENDRKSQGIQQTALATKLRGPQELSSPEREWTDQGAKGLRESKEK